jgi:HK97 family phage portal protein
LRFLGYELTLTKATPPSGLAPPASRGRDWWPLTVREPYTGAWQRNDEIRAETVLAYNAVYACVTLIASDISKMRVRLVEQDRNGIWSEVDVPAFSPVLRKPNRYQNRIKFIEQWMVSKLLHGNTYVLKQRDARGVVVAMYILDPVRTKPLVSPDGAVWYQLAKDNLTGIENSIVVPASEIIHDTMVPLFHPLCGVSPLIACGLAAMQGLSIQNNSTKFFENGAMPGGVLTAPGTIDDITATRLKEHWEKNYSGNNAGKVAVLGDGLKYEKMIMTAVESQMIEQLKWTAETVCSCFHVPPYMIGAAAAPAYNNIEALNQQYYSQCLQAPIEAIELCLDEGLALTTVQGHTYGTEFDLDDLLRMDTATQYKTIGDGIGAALLTPNEGRKKIGQKPLPGGDTAYMQQQNYSLAALNKRDQQEDPFSAGKAPAPTATPQTTDDEDEAIDDAAAKQIAAWSLKQSLESLPALNLLAA